MDRKTLASEERMEIWAALGLRGCIEIMEASTELAEAYTQEMVENPSLVPPVMERIAARIIAARP